MDLLPFALLAGALAMFLLSTRQMSLSWRLLIWAGAAILLGAAALMALGMNGNTGLLGSLFRHPETVIAAFQANWPSVGEFVGPTLDILIMLSALVAVASLIALTPGEDVERVVRPINISLIGAVIGGILVLAISAIGFGPVSKRQVFMDYIDAGHVIDGDTIRMGDVSLRIWGIDAPEDHQICLRSDNSPFDCGSLAADVFRKLAIPGPIICGSPEKTGAAGPTPQLEESFGRPLVSCGSDQQGYGGLPDVARELVELGFAYPYKSRDGVVIDKYSAELEKARSGPRGLHNGTFIEPTEWRNNPRKRCALVANAGPVTETDPEERARLGAQLKRLKRDCEPPP